MFIMSTSAIYGLRTIVITLNSSESDLDGTNVSGGTCNVRRRWSKACYSANGTFVE